MRDPSNLIRPDLERIPDELTKHDQWILWKLVKNAGRDKLDKVPCNPDGCHMNAHDPGNWMSFEEVSQIYNKSNGTFSGVGFVLAGDGIIGLDWDDCVNGDGQPNPDKLKEIHAINSYCEYSPSGKGVRGFSLGKLPTNGKKNDEVGIEIYHNKRFLTLTGHPLPGMPTDVENCEGAVLDLYDHFFGNKPTDNNHKEFNQKNTFFDDVSGDNSHDALVRYTARLISKGLSREEVFEIGQDIIRSRVKEDKKEKRLKELPRIIDSAIRKYSPKLIVKKEFGFKKVGDLKLKSPDWMIKDLLEADSLAQIFGDPGCAKSFVAIDISACVSSGRDFHGHSTKQGAVCYIAGEGHNGLTRRFAAWGIKNDVDLKNLPLFVSTVPAALCDGDHAKQVFFAVDEIASEHGPPQLIVIDTLARNFGPGDEDRTKDMGAFVQTVDALRCPHKSTILIIHHTGHGNKERARGSIALTGAVDANYRMDQDKHGVVRFEAKRMKDAPSLPEPMAFKIRSIELGIMDDDGLPVTSAILDTTAYEPIAKQPDKGLGKWQDMGLEVLSDLHKQARDRLKNNDRDPNTARVSVEDWRKECFRHGMGRMAFSRIKKSLAARGEIQIITGFVTRNM